MLPLSRDYTDHDFDSLRARLLSCMKSVFPTWTDDQAGDFGTILLEAQPFVGDVLAFNLDAAAREAKWGTATQMRSLLRLAKQIAYSPKGASAATTSETITATGLLANVTLPTGTIIKTQGVSPVSFQMLADLTLTPGAPSGDVDVENSATVSTPFSPTGDPNQVQILGQTPYLSGSLVVTSTQGTWTQVANFLSSRSSDLHYTVFVDATDTATVTFGDGVSGAIPIGTTTFVYKTGGGATGMVDAGAISQIQGTFYDTLGNRVTLSATNAAATIGGEEKETVSTIKVRAPSFIRAGNRTVSREDFETRGRAAAGVGRSLMLTRTEDPSIDPNTGKLWVVPPGLGFLTPTIRSNIAAQFVLYPYAPTFVLSVEDPFYLDVSITATIYLQGSAKASTVKAAIIASLVSWFALTTTDLSGNVIDNPTSAFGYYIQDPDGNPVGSLSYSDLFTVVERTVGVRKIGGNPEDFLLSSILTKVGGGTPVQTSVHADLLLNNQEYPRFLGASAIVLTNGDTGATL
jgi:hypothetical protein